MPDYERRARELMLSPDATRAYLALNIHADQAGICPGCLAPVDGYESSRVDHARKCDPLKFYILKGSR